MARILTVAIEDLDDNQLDAELIKFLESQQEGGTRKELKFEDLYKMFTENCQLEVGEEKIEVSYEEFRSSFARIILQDLGFITIRSVIL